MQDKGGFKKFDMGRPHFKVINLDEVEKQEAEAAARLAQEAVEQETAKSRESAKLEEETSSGDGLLVIPSTQQSINPCDDINAFDCDLNDFGQLGPTQM